MSIDHQQPLLKRIEHLNRIGAALSAQQDINDLLEIILVGAKELTNADAGSLYLLNDGILNFELIHTSSLGIHMGGSSDKAITFPSIPLEQADGTPNTSMVVTRCVIEDRLINIDDAYSNNEFDFSGTKAFDATNGYRSSSLLAVPMKDHKGQISGVLQLVNAIDPATGKATNFSPTDESMVTSLASQAAIALTRKQLIDGLEELLKSLVQLVANAIDDKSPHTGGHCRRVPEITMALADAVNNCNDQLYGETRFNYRELQELEMAAWLHDCGKIITPDHIIDKQSKLETVFDRIDLIDARLNILRLEAEKAHLQAQGASETGVLEKTLEEIEQMRQFIHQCNTGGEFLSADKIERIGEIANYTGCKGAASLANPLLNDDEVHNLSISKGTLTEEERQKINDHAGISMRMLSSLPFPEHLQNIPEIAGSHHERMDGKGYPRSVPAAELPLQARIIAIADIFEALTASDRGYRKPNTLSEALKIMTFMCKEGHLDPELFDLFVSTEAYLDYASKQMQPEQRDQVDIASIRQNIQKTED